MNLYEDLKLIFLREIPDIYLMIIDGEFALSFYSVYHKCLIKLPALLGLNMKLEDVRRNLLLDDPNEKFETLIVVLPVNRIRISLDSLVTVLVTLGRGL
jgi:hypothetical protein